MSSRPGAAAALVLTACACALPFAGAWGQPVAAARELEALAEHGRFRDWFDGGHEPPAAVELPAPRGPVRLVPPLEDGRALGEAKRLLSHGTGGPAARVNPFVFHPLGAPLESAPSSGLEGFAFAERRLAATLGRERLAHHIDDSARYLDALLAPVAWTAEGRARISEIRASGGSRLERYGRLMEFVARYTEELRAGVASADRAAWVRSARIYEIFPRAFNLQGKRAASGGKSKPRFFADFRERDLAEIRDAGFDTLWVMGIFPIGRRAPFGTAGGSPYSIQDYEAVNPELGTPSEFKAFVERAHQAGMRVLIDLVANHTSMDSKLLLEDPSFFLHRPAGDGPPPKGFFEHRDPASDQDLWIRHGGYDSYGSLAFWEDTAQLDYSNVRLRRRMLAVAEGWVRDFGVDGFRVDMAYQILNRYFSRNWGLAMPRREFLEELATEIKAKHPGTAFIAEAYDGFDELDRAGFDLIYSKNDIERPGGHAGWYDALVSRDPAWIRRAIRRASFLAWQRGGAGALPFTGNHDEPAPRRALGAWMEGATFLTLLQPGSLLFYGSQEIGFDRPNLEKEPKSIPFSVPVQVDWAAPDAKIKRFHQETFALAGEIHGLLGASDMEPLPLDESPGWVGFLLVSRQPRSLRAAAVVANPTDREVDVRFSHPETGSQYSGRLPPWGYRLVRF